MFLFKFSVFLHFDNDDEKVLLLMTERLVKLTASFIFGMFRN